MFRTRFAALTFAALTLAAVAAQALAADMPGPLVDAEWVGAHLADPDLVVLHVASFRRDYAAGHVPGARFLWTGTYAQGTPEMSYEMVPVEKLRQDLEALGVSDRSRVVLCGAGGNVSPTARALVTFDALGMGDRVAILDGGLEAWKAAGQKAVTEAPRVTRGTLHVHPQPGVLVDQAYVQAHLHQPGADLIDARAPNFYKGANAGQLHSGHIPGARNVYFATLVDSTNHMLPRAELARAFAKAGVHEGAELTAYCHVGQTASVVYLAARCLGRKVHLYDGSFDDWGGRADLPVETASPDSLTQH